MCPRIWPLANTLSSSIKDRLDFTLLQGPRYGWHCTPSFTAVYGLPLEDFLFESVDGRRYINLTFGIPQLDTVVDAFATTVSVASSYLIKGSCWEVSWSNLWWTLHEMRFLRKIPGCCLFGAVIIMYTKASSWAFTSSRNINLFNVAGYTSWRIKKSTGYCSFSDKGKSHLSFHSLRVTRPESYLLSWLCFYHGSHEVRVFTLVYT